ncbi:hypothetical protein F5Y17DRAFT_420722 [Xylariaceae sp. FL0594]|nr:hypothetical protein F5Y17DRAFT_420722 [Xylariaceae sp. FL0594]
MRLTCRALRNVKLKRPGLSSQVSLRPLHFQPHSSGVHRSIARAGRGLYQFLTSPSVTEAESDPILAELLHVAEGPPSPSFDSLQKVNTSLVQAAENFQKWRFLLADPGRLAIESDFRRKGPAKEWRRRLLVDEYENNGDIALWACLLEYQMRISGPAGVVSVWKALWGRKALYTVDGSLAEMFWRVILDGALASNDPNFLAGVWMYSEWMYSLHGVKWPHLYTTVITHMLRTHRHQEVLQWALRLTPNFYPGPDEFAAIIKQFSSDRTLYEPDTLESLYRINRDHSLYNTVASHLYDLGESELARRWRRLCIQYDDLPVEPVPAGAKAFLRFIKGYHRQHDREKLLPEETAAIQPMRQPEEERVEPALSREYMNIVHGKTFGIGVKDYDDRLGAKWFATRWVSLDLAISTAAALGVREIGPLSLQSIGLRVGGADELSDRITQLNEYGITLKPTKYLRVVLYLVRQKDDELLRDLLRSDLHPDVFQDIDLQTRLIESTRGRPNWRTLRLLLVARIVLFEQSAREMSDRLLELRFQHRDQDGVLRILEDMKLRNIPLNPDRAIWIYDSLLQDYKLRLNKLPIELSKFYLAVFRQLRTMDVPGPLSSWRLLIINMARNGWFSDLEKLCHDLIEAYSTSSLSRPGFIPVHCSDVPKIVRGPLWKIEKTQSIYIPHDLPAHYGNHPLRLLFNRKAITEMVERAFVAHPGQGFRTEPGLRPHGRMSLVSQIRTVIGLLRTAQKQTRCISVREVENAVTNCLVALYHPAKPSNARQRVMRAANTLTLKEMKTLIDEAWRWPLLPRMNVLAKIINEHDPAAIFDTEGDIEPTEEASVQ